MRERGLKQLYGTDGIGGEAVVPRAGTWIETEYENYIARKGIESSPVRERGLKLSSRVRQE